jgi:hypothetical protein
MNHIYFQTCEKHLQHHLEVEPDMKLNDLKYKASLFMGWNIFIYLFFIFLICFLSARMISGYPISNFYIVFLSLIASFIWEYLWNKIHVKMHEYEIEYSIKEGPYDENLFNTDDVKDMLLKNHTYHHLQKGDTKGNYNVIVLGADEWFGFNNKTIDNTEYCKTNTEETICA